MGAIGESRPFWEKPLSDLTDGEWEALCDGCGQCCLHKLEDADTGAIYETNVACTLLDVSTARCMDYPNRKAKVPDCLQLTRDTAGTLRWLPATCAYRLRAEGKPLPDWHHLLTGSYDAVRAAGVSVAGQVISEDDAGPIEEHVVIDGYELRAWPEEDDADDDADDDEETVEGSTR